MKLLSVVAVVIATGCTVVEPSPVVPKRPMDVDKTSRLMLSCEQLFLRGSDSYRLCIMRGVDRYVDHQTVPLSERYMRVPECPQWPCR